MKMINYLYQDEKDLIFKIDNNVYQLSKTDENDFCLSVIDSIDEIHKSTNILMSVKKFVDILDT